MTLKSLPPVQHAQFLERVRETLHILLGRTGDSMDRVLTMRDVASGSGGSSGGKIVIGGSTADDEPDLNPPPTPTGLAVTAGMTYLTIECDAQVYTQGHGHDRTIVYGASRASGAPAPTFSDAVELCQFQGTVYSHPVQLGTIWHIWIKWRSVDGVLSASPAGGVNGVSATTGKVGNSDLNDEIITASKLADRAIDALDKFIPELEPVYIVNVLPDPTGYAGPKTVYLNGDGKLYRYVSGAWTSTIPTTDLTGQIINGQLALNAVTADKIQAGAVVAGKLAASAIVAGDGVIANAAITNALIANLAVDNAKIANMSVSKLTAGALAVGQYIQSTSYVAGSSGWRINADGTAEMNNLTLRGTIYSQAGQIGGLNINTDNVCSSNYLFANSGFALMNTGVAFFNEVNGGGFSSYAWPAAGYTGFHLSSQGMKVGNPNDRGYFHIEGSTGNVYAPDFSIVGGNATFSGVLDAASGTFNGNLSAAGGSFAGSLSAATGTFSGTLTATAVNAVNTINIAGNAVTLPVSGAASALVSVTASGEQTLVTATNFTCAGGPVAVTFGSVMSPAEAPITGLIKIYRSGTLIFSVDVTISNDGTLYVPTVVDTPTAGTSCTYSVTYQYTGGTSSIGAFTYRSLYCLETRR